MKIKTFMRSFDPDKESFYFKLEGMDKNINDFLKDKDIVDIKVDIVKYQSEECGAEYHYIYTTVVYNEVEDV